MALPKKKSRVISVDNIKYRWLVKDLEYDSRFLMIQNEESNGQKLVVNLEISTDEGDFNNVTPAKVEMIIKRAKEMGWENKSNKMFGLYFENGELKKRKSYKEILKEIEDRDKRLSSRCLFSLKESND